MAEANPATTPVKELVNKGLSAAVERHLSEYFAARKDGIPAAGLCDRILSEVERPLLSLSLTATRGN